MRHYSTPRFNVPRGGWKRKNPVGEKAYHWKGGKVMVGNYPYLYMPNHPYARNKRYVQESRYIMEQSLGRFLTPKEVVHHIDGNPLNNKIENLVLCKTHGQHSIKYHNDWLLSNKKY